MADRPGPRLLLVLCILVAGCAAPPPPTASDLDQARATDVEGAFELAFELPRTTYRAGEPIDGRASLAILGSGAVAFGSSGGGPFVFDFEELNGRRHVGGAMTADCAPYRLAPGRPMASAIKKSGGFSGDDPEAPFYEAFLAGPIVRLPAGDWRITAAASLVEGEGCSGVIRNLAAPIVIHVLP